MKNDITKFDLMMNVSNGLGEYLKNMNTNTWSNLSSKVCPNGKTVWQMILYVEPCFPKSGRTYNLKGKMIKDWSEIPTKVIAIRAVRYGEMETYSLNT